MERTEKNSCVIRLNTLEKVKNFVAQMSTFDCDIDSGKSAEEKNPNKNACQSIPTDFRCPCRCYYLLRES